MKDQTIVLIGGSEDKKGDREILREFVRLSGGGNARIVTITAASCIPEETGEEYDAAFGVIGSKSHRLVHVQAEDEVATKEVIEELDRATGIFLTGGDQLRGMGFCGAANVFEVLLRRYREGAVMAGTSAGAAMMSDTMITGRKSRLVPRPGVIQVKAGLGIIRGVIVDTHFSKRGRFGRLAVAVTRHPQSLGIGLDDNTALVVRNGRTGEVVGEGTVTLIDGRSILYSDLEGGREDHPLTVFGLRVNIVAAHHPVDLEERGILAGAHTSPDRRDGLLQGPEDGTGHWRTGGCGGRQR